MAELWSLLQEIFSALSKIGSFVIVIGGLASFLFREKIKQMLSKSAAAELEKTRKEINQELAEQAARHQRELESYKVTLIAEAEKIKSAQEIKKSLALRIAERRFIAVSGLLDAFSGLEVDVVSLAVSQYQGPPAVVQKAFMDQVQEILARLQKLRAAMNGASPLLDLDTKLKLADAHKKIASMLALRSSPDAAAVDQNSDEVKELFASSLTLEAALGSLLAGMENID